MSEALKLAEAFKLVEIADIDLDEVCKNNRWGIDAAEMLKTQAAEIDALNEKVRYDGFTAFAAVVKERDALRTALNHIVNDNWPDSDINAAEYAQSVLNGAAIDAAKEKQ